MPVKEYEINAEDLQNYLSDNSLWVEITPSRVPTVAIVIPEVSTDTVTLETVSTILSFLLSVCLFSLYRSVNRIA